MAIARALSARLLSLLLLAPAAHAYNGSIIDTAVVAKAMSRGAIVWDVRSTEAYFDGHLPGAVTIGFVADALLDEKTQLFQPIGTLARRLGDAGIDLRREIVVYGTAGSVHPYFAQFALDYFGARRVHVYHQGIDGWRAAGRPVSSAPAKRAPVRVRPFANPAVLATSGEVLARIGKAGVQFVDTRRPGEFVGDESETLHGGHIPGAILIPYTEQLVDPDAPRKIMAKETQDRSGMALKRKSELAALYAGLDKHKETIVYCHTGVRAAMTASVLASLGFRSVRLYHASWLEYGNRPEAPVEQ